MALVSAASPRKQTSGETQPGRPCPGRRRTSRRPATRWAPEPGAQPVLAEAEQTVPTAANSAAHAGCYRHNSFCQADRSVTDEQCPNRLSWLMARGSNDASEAARIGPAGFRPAGRPIRGRRRAAGLPIRNTPGTRRDQRLAARSGRRPHAAQPGHPVRPIGLRDRTAQSR